MLNKFKEKKNQDNISIGADVMLGLLPESNITFEDIKREAQGILRRNRARAVILLDSIDNYRLDSKRFETVLSGLLMSVGSFNITRGAYEVRFCLPGELYFEFTKLSSNMTKDFSQMVVLHWSSGELLSLSAMRYLLYLELYSDEGDKKLIRKLRALNLHVRDDAISFFEMIFPE